MKKIYVCGPTVYDSPHIGNLRPIMTFDIAIRAMRYLGEQVDFIHNITDIDDKIIVRSLEQNVSEKEIAKQYLNEYLNLLQVLNITKPNQTPKVTDYIKEIVTFIGHMLQSHHAYERNGNVYFDVTTVANYGKLSNWKLEEIKSEEVASHKLHDADFALWKKTQQGITFDSPWGKGRPGWHTECAVFIDHYCQKKALDIHGGGIDLLFPHHENENAQYLAVNGVEIAKTWLHVGHLLIEGKKMSKSLGNFITANDFIKLNGIDTMRYIFLTSKVTSPLDLTTEKIRQAKEAVLKLEKMFKKALLIVQHANVKINSEIAEKLANFNFSDANFLINESIKKFNKNAEQNADEFVEIMKLLGYAFTNYQVEPEFQMLYNKWVDLRKTKEYAKADELRQELVDKDLI